MSSASSSKKPTPLSIETKKVNFMKIEHSAPPGREGHCACAIGDKLYVFGGVCQSASDDSAESSDLWMLDSSCNKDKWMKVDGSGELPPPRSNAVLNAVGKKLYLFGGLSQFSGWFSDVCVFDTENANWSKLTTAGTSPSGRDKLASCVIGTKIYYFGGFGPKGSIDDLEEDDGDDEYEDIEEDEIRDVKQQQKAMDFGWFNDLHIFDTATNAWNQPMQMNLGVPSMRAAHGICALGQDLLIFGGRDPDGRQNDVHIFNTETRKWQLDMKESGCPPDRRSFHSVTTVNENLALVFGGRSEANDHFQDCHVFNKLNTTWYKVPVQGSIPAARGCHTCTLVDGKIVIYGGSAKFMPEIQHCLEILGDVLFVEVKDIVDAVTQVSSNGAH